MKVKKAAWLPFVFLCVAVTTCNSTGGDGAPGSGENAAPAFHVRRSSIGIHNGYTWEFWNQDGLGSPVMSLGEGSAFHIKWAGIYNMLARIGIRPGDANTRVSYSVQDYRAGSGISYLAVYGWTYNKARKDNLVEFYIVENWIDFRPPGNGGTLKGSVVVDGDEYDIYTSPRVQQPSIFGTRTFTQYWSVRKEGQQRLKGTIDVASHFAAWEKLGMHFGDTLYEVSFTVEGFDGTRKGNGTARVTELTFTKE